MCGVQEVAHRDKLCSFPQLYWPYFGSVSPLFSTSTFHMELTAVDSCEKALVLGRQPTVALSNSRYCKFDSRWMLMLICTGCVNRQQSYLSLEKCCLEVIKTSQGHIWGQNVSAQPQPSHFQGSFRCRRQMQPSSPQFEECSLSVAVLLCVLLAPCPLCFFFTL